jgi:hypothetical protein
MRLTKSEAEYRLPQGPCCARCNYSYRNSYGDNQCNQMVPEDSLIDAGGLCNNYKEYVYELHGSGH